MCVCVCVFTFFPARQSQIQLLLSQQDSLSTAHKKLEKEQEEVKGQLDAFRHSLTKVRSTGQEILSKVNLLHLSLSKSGLAEVDYSNIQYKNECCIVVLHSDLAAAKYTQRFIGGCSR